MFMFMCFFRFFNMVNLKLSFLVYEMCFIIKAALPFVLLILKFHVYFKHILKMVLCVGSQDISLSNDEALPSVQETSIKRLVVGPLNVRLHSSAVHRILKMIICAMDHEYEPYSKQRQGQYFSYNYSSSLICNKMFLH